MRKGGNGAVALVIIIAVMAILVFMAVTRKSNTVQANKNKLFDDVMAFDFEAAYPSSPDEVLEKYDDIDRLLSGNTPEDLAAEDLRTIVEKQRMLLHPELLELNPVEAHVKGYEEKIEYLNSVGLRMMQIDRETPIFSNDAELCTIGARQYWSSHIQADMVYNLKKDDAGKWKIIGWYVNDQEGEQS